MKQSGIIVGCGIALTASLLLGQDAPASNPFSTEAKQAWTRTIGNVLASAEKMPEDGYAYKATPESMSFRDIVAHAADSAMGACSAFNGERKSAGAKAMATKAELVGAVKAAQSECEKAYGSLTDAKASEMVAGGRGPSRTRLGMLWGNTVHIEHEYAQMAVDLRLKGQVPPSSEKR